MTHQRPLRRTVDCLFFKSTRPSAFCRPCARGPKFLDHLSQAALSSLAAVLLVLGMALPGLAATDTVTSLADDGTAGTLRSVINASSAGDTVIVASNVTGTINLTCTGAGFGPLTISKNMTISGPGASSLAISGGGQCTVMQVNGGVTAAISGVTIENGNAGGGSGGGINNGGTLTVSDCTLSGNTSASQASGGGAIINTGTLIVNNSTFSGNSATGNSPMTGFAVGGGIANGGTLTVSNSTFVNNSTMQAGGGIFNEQINGDGAGTAPSPVLATPRHVTAT